MGSWMGLIGSVIVVIDALAQCTAAQTTYNVGGSAGWTFPFNGSWVRGKTFAVGDELNFTFNAQAHDVSEVTKTEYENCTNTGSNYGSSLFITLTTTGEHYYICTFPGHCLGGQKLSINVVSSTTTSSPSSAPSRAAAFGVAGAFMAVLTALFL